jgi:hypothetical protein
VKDRANDLLKTDLVAVNIGLSDFAENLKIQGVKVTHVNWSPPAGGDPELVDLLDQLL